jgi:hypothetical protein
MLIRRQTTSLGGSVGLGTAKCVTAYKSASSSSTRSKLFQPGSRLLVHRAPAFCGLSVQASTSSVHSKFQRPMTKRRSYDKGAELALQKSSLGPKRRMNGMAKLLARAGRGLTFQLPVAKTTDGNDTGDESDSEEENKEPDRPFEPLCVWTSPHQGAEAKGLMPRTCVYYMLSCALLCCASIIIMCVMWLDLSLTPSFTFSRSRSCLFQCDGNASGRIRRGRTSHSPPTRSCRSLQ